MDSFLYKGKWHEYIHDVQLLITSRVSERVSYTGHKRETMAAVSYVTVELKEKQLSCYYSQNSIFKHICR